MSREATELRIAIAENEARRERLRLRAMFVQHTDPDRADTLDEFADACSDEIARLRRDLCEIEASEQMKLIGWRYNPSET